MKKLLSLILASLLAASVMVGCTTEEGKETKDSETQGSEVNESQSESDSESETEPPVEVIDDGRPEFDGGIIFNIDTSTVTGPFVDVVVAAGDTSDAAFYPFVDQYANSQVDTLIFQIFSKRSMTPSEVWQDVADINKRTDENGVAVDYSNEEVGFTKCYDELNIDPYGIWIERCKEVGIEPWISIRTNDIHDHYSYTPTSSHRDIFYYEAMENSWFIGDGQAMPRHGDTFSYSYDYAEPVIYQRMLNYIEEQLNRYDVYGFELDYLRELVNVDYIRNKDAVEIMTNFMRDVKKLVTAAEEKYGHKIKIAVRLARDIDQCKKFGLDAETWAAEGLIDVISLDGRFRSVDTDIPIAVWKERCPNVHISGGISYNFYRYDKDGKEIKTKLNTDMANGMAAAYVAQGVDSIYLYNWFQNPYNVDSDWSRTAYELIQLVGDSDTIFSNSRRHIITYQDDDSITVPIGFKPYIPLPKTIAAGKTEEFSLPIGFVQEDKTVRLILGIGSGTPADMVVTVNDKVCENLVACDEAMLESLKDMRGDSVVFRYDTLYYCEIPAESLDRYTISITANAEVLVDYIEINIQ